MVPLTRGPTPRALATHADDWTNSYLAELKVKPAQHPRSERYAHSDVRVELRRMSHGKCFYCERKLTEAEGEVDHHVEVAERPDLAFAWPNLYLACAPCNRRKAPNTQIPVASCVDPCAQGVEPQAHLAFVDERIEPRAGSGQGTATIAKYRLNRDELDYARCRALNEFRNAVIFVLMRQNAEGRHEFSDDERELLRAYAGPTRPFTLMMAAQVRALGL